MNEKGITLDAIQFYMYYINEEDVNVELLRMRPNGFKTIASNVLLRKIVTLTKDFGHCWISTLDYGGKNHGNQYLFEHGVVGYYVDNLTGIAVEPNPSVHKQAFIMLRSTSQSSLEKLADGMGLPFDISKVSQRKSL
ncbi:MAG: hypothetical protein AABX66_04020 [Nanoarchaeota archaeon]